MASNYKVLAAETNVATDATGETLMSNIMDAILFPITGDDNKVQTKSGALMAAVVHNVIGAAWGGYVARKRAERGQKAMLGFIL